MSDVLDEEFTPLIGGGHKQRETASLSRGWGSRFGFGCELEWSGDKSWDGRLTISMGGAPIWTEAVNGWQAWGSLLSGLARSWDHLRVEQTFPLGANPRSPSRLPDVLAEQLGSGGYADELVVAFRAHHDLSCWLPGDAAALWFVREGAEMAVEAVGTIGHWPLNDVVRSLSMLGDELSRRATRLSVGNEAVADWRGRDRHDDTALRAIGIGIPVAHLRRLERNGTLRPVGRLEVLRGLDEVAAAARMLAGQMSDQQLAAIAAAIRAQPKHENKSLDEWSTLACVHVRAYAKQVPHAQGKAMAGWFRSRLGLLDDQRFEPEETLEKWKVPIIDFSGSPRIEAIAFWGPMHGPAILFNNNGKSNAGGQSESRSGGGRATLSHEICHLLLDRSGSLPVAEALGGQVPAQVEERAKAFAAEVLLPEPAAGRAYTASSAVEESLTSLTRTFGVSRTLAAWQVLKHFGTGSPVLTEPDRLSLLHEARRKQRSSTFSAS